MTKLIPENKQIKFNRAQLRTLIHNPKIQVDVWGRGTGKSTNKGWRMHRKVLSMPRSAHIITGATFQQILTRTLPATFEALETLGYEKDIHYVIGKEPPKHWKKPYQQPLNFERFISFNNGTGFHLSSQDREGMARGYNVDSVDGDEALTLDKTKFENEALAANRGNLRFKGNALHHGIDLSSSMPTNQKGKWVLDFANYYEEDGYNIWLVWNKLVQLQLRFIDSHNDNEKQELMMEIRETYRMVRFYKSKDGVLFTLANVFDNLSNLGWDYIKQMRRTMTDISFRIEILNEKIDAIDDCFYKLEEKHFYANYNYSYLDALDYDFKKLKSSDCRQDMDLLPGKPLDMVVDFGASINVMWIGQEYHNMEYRFIKTFHVLYPSGLKDLCTVYDNYYQHHNHKTIMLWYDHTAISRDAVRESYVLEMEKELTRLGWRVMKNYIGQAPAHTNKYLLWDLILKGDQRMPNVFFNRYNCKEGILSMQLAGVKIGKNGFEKDKSSERNKSIPAAQATHYSDAVDIPIWGRYSNRLNGTSQWLDVVLLKQ